MQRVSGQRFVMGLVVVTAMALAAPTAARAGVQYTNQATFNAAVLPGSYLENFQSFATFSTHAPSLNFQGGTANQFKYTATTPAQAFFIEDQGGNRALSTSGDSSGWARDITFTFTGAPVYAVGGNFFLTSAFGVIQGDAFNVSFSDGTVVNLSGQGLGSFFGYISFAPLTSFTVHSPATHRFVDVDALRVGTSNVPGASAAGLAALAGFVAGRRRR